MTKYNTDIHHRSSVRLRKYDYSQAGLYFVTLCVKDHICVFGEIEGNDMILNECGRVAQTCWLSIPQHYPHVTLHEFVVMPNHIHGILEIVERSSFSQTDVPYGVGVEYLRPDKEPDNNRVEDIRPLRRPNCASGTIGAITRGFKIGVTKQIGASVWQRNYYEHIIRDPNRHAVIVDYINNNPARWEDDRFYTSEE